MRSLRTSWRTCPHLEDRGDTGGEGDTALRGGAQSGGATLWAAPDMRREDVIEQV
jgi:hypothetical protein